jgi:FG-GAP repeat
MKMCRTCLFALTCLPLAAVAAPATAAPASAITEQKLQVPDPTKLDDFGAAVAIHKSLAVVGSPGGYSGPDLKNGGEFWSGGVYLFRRRRGQWIEEALLGPSDASNQDSAAFGHSVATDGKTIVVGATALDNGGAAYVFEKVSGDWKEVQKLTGPTQKDDNFGWAVAVEGDTIAVGARSQGAGKVYVFTRDADPSAGGGWQRTDTLEGEGGKGGASSTLGFGRSLDISGGRLAVGAPGHDPSDESTDAGAVFVFVRQEEGWEQEAMLRASDELRWLYFGERVAIDRRNLVIGSRGDWDETGAAYVFERTPSGWVEAVKLIASQAVAGDWAGADAVAIHGRRILLGAKLDGEAGGRSGAMYLFKKMGRNWIEAERLLPPDGRPDHQFGGAVAVFRKTLLVGAYRGDTGGQIGVGAAYVFE